MHPDVTAKLLEINRAFYRDYASAFAATRKRIQPGVRRVLEQLPAQKSRFVDLGCGSGALAQVWGQSGRRGLYLGLDFSPTLLEEARQTAATKSYPGLEIQFLQADLSHPNWIDLIPKEPPPDGVLVFAVLHHIPDAASRLRLLKQIRNLLGIDGIFVLSVWQFQHSLKWMARRLPWERVGIRDDEVEEGDFLLDWRHTLPGQDQKPGLRYVHLFTREELSRLAANAGFSIQDEFESDGQGGRLGLYQTWRTV
ncbi:MAG: class I SAM-dependent methyltransferase [Anaerolineae bacterium]|nr:class I SAM-dependent methyltransferase [Anaerolineae bacterium]